MALCYGRLFTIKGWLKKAPASRAGLSQLSGWASGNAHHPFSPKNFRRGSAFEAPTRLAGGTPGTRLPKTKLKRDLFYLIKRVPNLTTSCIDLYLLQALFIAQRDHTIDAKARNGLISRYERPITAPEWRTSESLAEAGSAPEIFVNAPDLALGRQGSVAVLQRHFSPRSGRWRARRYRDR